MGFDGVLLTAVGLYVLAGLVHLLT
jgi:hypothetical protein